MREKKMKDNFTTYNKDETSEKKISIFWDEDFFYLTGIKAIDRLGGIPSGEITEIVGPPGVGKSNLLHQIASYIAYKYPNAFLLYVDSDNTFDPKKILVYSKYFNTDYSVVMKRIVVYRPSSFDIFAKYLMDTNMNKPIFLIIDSMPNFVFFNTRDIMDDSSDYQNKIVYRIGVFLSNFLMQNKKSAILTSNQIRFSPQIINEKSKYEEKIKLKKWSLWAKLGYVPALGNIWSNFVDNRFLLHKIRRNLKALQVIYSRHWLETTLFVEVKKEIIFK